MHSGNITANQMNSRSSVQGVAQKASQAFCIYTDSYTTCASRDVGDDRMLLPPSHAGSIGGGAASLQLTAPSHTFIPINYVANALSNLSYCLHLLCFQKHMLHPSPRITIRLITARILLNSLSDLLLIALHQLISSSFLANRCRRGALYGTTL